MLSKIVKFFFGVSTADNAPEHAVEKNNNSQEESKRLFCLRQKSWAVPENAFPNRHKQFYYTQDDVVDKYDIIAYKNGSTKVDPKTFMRMTRLQSLEVATQLGAQKFLDLGCGAGTFFYLLDTYYPNDNFEYFGVDISERQVERAQKNFEDPRASFAVGDVSMMVHDISAEYDAIHMNSVLNFMRPERQLRVLEKLLADESASFLEFSVTRPEVEYVPSRTFKNLGTLREGDALFLSEIGFCFYDDVVSLLKENDFWNYSEIESSISVAPATNESDLEGGCLMSKEQLKENTKNSEDFPSSTDLKIVTMRVWPRTLSYPEPDPETLVI